MGQAAFPAPQAEQTEQRARQDPIDQQYAYQPAGPGVPCGFAGQGGVAAGADQLGVRQREAKQRRQGAERLGKGDEGIAAENGGFPDEAVAAGRQQAEEHGQRGQQAEQPEPVDQRAEAPARQPAPAEQDQ